MHVIVSLVCVCMMLSVTNGAGVNSSLVTFNVGLLHTIPQVEQRKEEMIKKLKEMDTDVVCLQEVFFASDVNDIIQSLDAEFPFTHSALHASDGTFDYSYWHWSPCSWWSMWSFMCVSIWCDTSKPYEELLGCAIQECDIWEDLSQECVTCALVSGFEEGFGNCFGSLSTDMNIPGLILLSKRPLHNRKTIPFITGIKQLFPKSMLVADVEGIGPISCTHLTTDVPNSTFFEPDMQGMFDSFEEENAFETQSIIDYFKDDDKAIVMGDINAGPQIDEKNIAGDIKESFDIFTSNGYTSPYVTMVGKGTYTAENPYTDDSVDVIIDHVLVKGGHNTIAAKRVFDETYDNIGGPLSDHYGVEVTVRSDDDIPE